MTSETLKKMRSKFNNSFGGTSARRKAIYERDEHTCLYCMRKVISISEVIGAADVCQRLASLMASRGSVSQEWYRQYHPYQKLLASGWFINQRATLDHVIPLCHGGTNEEDNLVTCCFPCNAKKHTS